MSFDIHAEKEKDRPYQEFLDGPGNAVMMLLVDAETNIVKAIRFIGIKHDVANAIRGACREQLTAYPSSEALDKQLQYLLREYPADKMEELTEMVRL